jgi:hypothetical protein
MAINVVNKDLEAFQFQEGRPTQSTPVTYRPVRPLLPIAISPAVQPNNSIQTIKNNLVTAGVGGSADSDPFMKFRGPWNSFTTYSVNDVVLFNQSSYVCVQGNLNSEPDTPATATIAVRQTASAGNSGGSPLGVGFSLPVLPGSAIIACIFAQNIGTAQNVLISDTFASTYQLLLTSPAVDGNEYWNSVYIVTGVHGAGSVSVNSVWPASDTGPGNKYIIIAEVTGLRVAQPDQTASAGTRGTFLVPPSFGLQCNDASDLIFTAANNDNGALTAPTGFTSAIAGGSFAGIAWAAPSFVGTNPIAWGGAGFRFTGVGVSLFPQVSTANWALIGENPVFNVPASAAQFNPYEVIFFEGSMYVCLRPTTLTPFTDPKSWALWAQGVGGVINNPGNYTPLLGDDGRLIFYSSSSNQTLTLPNPPFNNGWWILVQNVGSGVLTVSRNGLNINGQGFNATLNQNQGALFFTDGTNYFTFNGVGTVTNSSGALTLNQVVLGNGGNDIKVQGSLGTVNQVLHGNAAGPPTWSPVVEADQSLSDILTDNVSTSMHGYAPKLPGDPTKFLNGAGAYVAPSGIIESDASATGTLITHTVSGVLRLPGNVIPPAGVYRVSVNFFLQANPSAGTLDVAIGWNDGTATRSATNGTLGAPADISTAGLNVADGTIVVVSDGIHDITWTMTLT